MIDRKKFDSLAQVTGLHCISLFVPTHRAGQEQEDRIRYKNTLSEVKNKLIEKGLNDQEASKILKEANTKIDDLEFWQHQSDGLAVFIENGQTTYHQLPISFSPFSYVSNQLYLKPVMPILTGNAKFFLLAISQQSTRFFEGERYAITEIDTSEYLPKDINDLMKFIEGEQQLQQHSGQSNQDQAIFHGHGGSKDMEDVRLREYLRMINKGVMELMCDDDTEPLILATVEETAALYREVNEYVNLHQDFIPGNAEEEDVILLHEKAWELMRPEVEDEQMEINQKFEAALANNEASFSIHDIVPAAIAGRIKTLFVSESYEIWGTYESTTHTISIHEEREAKSQPLLNWAATQTIKNGGTVYVLPQIDLPRPTGGVNAIYRYASVTA